MQPERAQRCAKIIAECKRAGQLPDAACHAVRGGFGSAPVGTAILGVQHGSGGARREKISAEKRKAGTDGIPGGSAEQEKGQDKADNAL